MIASRLTLLRRVPALLHGRIQRLSGKAMSQVDVDSPEVRKNLGKLQMGAMKKAESSNLERATRHRFWRKRDWKIAATCATLIAAIYGYTIYAMKQESFLDDFDMPDPLEERSEKKMD